MAKDVIVHVVVDAKAAEHGFRRSSNAAKKFDHDLSKTVRGALAGSGAFKSLGRSLAFASGGFLAGASVTALLGTVIKQGTEAAATQKQLAAQFKASGLNLADYSDQIEKATTRVSQLAGIEDDELKRAFTTAFRGSQNVSTALKIQAIAADVARGRHIELSLAAGALTKAYGGQTTALKRLQIQVPSNLKGMEALDFVARRFAGQAAAGATEQDKFRAALQNTAETIGLTLLPTLNKYLSRLTKWLNEPKNQKKVQDDVNKAVKTTTFLLDLGRHSVEGYTLAWKRFSDLMHKLGGPGLDQAALLAQLGGGGLRGPVGTPIPVLPSGMHGPTRAPGTPLGQRAGLRAQLLRNQLALAKAQVTADKQDDRLQLAEQARILRAIIARTTNLKKRRELYLQLASVQEQIRAIDDQAASAKETARQKELDARKKEHDAMKAHLEKLRGQEAALKSKMQAIRDNFAAAIQTAREGIGALFTGPVLNPTDDARRHILGVGRPMSQDPAKIAADVRAQTKEFLRRQRDIAAIQKRAPKGLRAALGTELAGADIGTLDALAKNPTAFLKAFAQRQAVATKTARVLMSAQLVTLHAAELKLAGVREKERPIIIELDGKVIARSTDTQQKRSQKNNAASRRGRNAGRG